MQLVQRRLPDPDNRILTLYVELFGTACILIDDNEYVTGKTRRDREIVRKVLAGEPLRTWETLIGPQESDGGADRYYQYATVGEAAAAYEAMRPGDVEPGGWIRASPPPFRRRPGGDATLEYVGP